MKKLFRLLIILMIIPSVVFAKEETVKQFTNDNITRGGYMSVSKSDGNNYVAVGQSDTKSVIVKYNEKDEIIKTVETDENIVFKDVEYTSDGGYIIVGFQYDTKKGIAYKYDKDFKVEWNKVFDDLKDLWDVEIYDDGTYAAVGINGTNATLVKLDKQGKTEWTGESNSSRSGYYGLTITKDQSVVAVGFNSDSSSMVSKYDKNGKLIWEYFLESDRTVTYEENLGSLIVEKGLERGFVDVVEDDDGNYVIVGNGEKAAYEYIRKRFVDYDDENLGVFLVKNIPVIIKLDKNGKVLYIDSYEIDKNPEHIMNGEASLGVSFFDIVKTNDGYYVTASIANINSRFTNEVKKQDENLGNINISKNFGYATFIKYDEELKLEYQYKAGEYDYYSSYYDVEMLDNGTFVGVGFENTGMYTLGYFDVSTPNVIKLNIKYNITDLDTKNGTFESIQDYNNGLTTIKPNEGFMVDKIVVKDSKGKEVDLVKNSDGTYSFDLYDDVTVLVTFAEIPPVPENPKTGIASYTSILLFVAIVAFIIRANISNKEVFKGL